MDLKNLQGQWAVGRQCWPLDATRKPRSDTTLAEAHRECFHLVKLGDLASSAECALQCLAFPHHFHIFFTTVTALSPHIPKQQMSTDLLQGKCGKTHPSGPHFMQPFMAVTCSWKSRRISVTSDSPSQIVSRKLMAANVLHDAHQASADVFSVNHGESC